MSTIASDAVVVQPTSSAPRSHINVSKLAAHLALLFFVALWTFPTVGLLVSSVRDKDQLAVSGWCTALTDSTQQNAVRVGRASDQVEEGGAFVIRGNVLGADARGKEVQAFGTTNADLRANAAGATAAMRDGGEITIQANGDYVWTSPTEFTHTNGPRLYLVVGSPPRFTLDNYVAVLSAEGISQSFINSITVAIPSTVIPILIAAFAAYALAWMTFPFRGLIVALVVGLLVVPLQMSLIPLLRMYNGFANALGTESKGYFGVWLAHTAFGLPLAIYLLRNYMPACRARSWNRPGSTAHRTSRFSPAWYCR